MRSVEQELQKMQAWLGDRESYWRGEVASSEKAVSAAIRALEKCNESARNDAQQQVRYVRYDCSQEQAALRHAIQRLHYAQGELKNVRHYRNLIETAGQKHKLRSQQHRAFLQNDLARACAKLSYAAQHLKAYVDVPIDSTESQ